MAAVDLDDSDAHARRNVVVLSASILFAGYLNLKVPILMSILSFDAATETSQLGKMWGVLFVLLTYFVLRYHFAPSREERWTAGAKVLEGLHLKWFRPWARKHQAAELTERIRAKRPDSTHVVAPDIFLIRWLRVDGWRNVSYQYATEDEGNDDFEDRYHNDNAEHGCLPVGLALWNVIASFVVRIFLSRDGLEVAVPYLLALVAALVCAIKAGWI